MTLRTRSSRRNLYTAGILSLLALIIALMRLQTWDEPVNRDLATYALIAREMLGGRELYADLWDHKPPAIFWTYTAAQGLVGDGQQTFYLMIVAATIATMLGISAAASAWSHARGWICGLYAAAAWTLVGGTLPLQANEPNTEPFINTCLVWAFALLLRMEKQTSRGRRAAFCVAIGLLLGWASLYKTVVVAHALAFGAAMLLPAGRGDRWPGRLALPAVMGAAAALPWLIVLGVFAARDTLLDMVEAVFTYNMFYADQGGSGAAGNVLTGLAPKHLLPKEMRSWLPLLVVGLLGFALGRPLPRRLRLPALCLLFYAAATPVAVALPGQFYPHYYQYWGPPLAIGGAWGLFLLQRRFPGGRHILTGLFFGVLILLEAPGYLLTGEQWARRKYGPDPSRERQIGRFLNRQVLAPGETLYQWGSAIPLLHATGRPLPSGVFFIGPVLGGPFTEKGTTRLLADLERNRPALVLVDVRDVPPLPSSPVEQYLARNYSPLMQEPLAGRFLPLARKGSSLEARRDQVVRQLQQVQ